MTKNSKKTKKRSQPIDWAAFWESELPGNTTPTAPELLDSTFVRDRAPAAFRELWKRTRTWGEPDLRVCIGDVEFAMRYPAPVPGGFTFGHNYGGYQGWRGLFLDTEGFCGMGNDAVMAWVPQGRYEHLYFASPSLEALVERLAAVKRLSLRALGAAHAAGLKKAMKKKQGEIIVTPPSVERPNNIILRGNASTALSWLYNTFGSLEIPARDLRIVDQQSFRSSSSPAGHWIGEDPEADYVVSRATLGKVDGRLLRAPKKDGAPPTDLGYLLDVVRRWIEAL